MEGSFSGSGETDDLRLLGRILAGLPTESDTNWACIVDAARRQRVSALLYWRLGESKGGAEGGTHAPQEVLDELRQDLYTAATQAMLAERQLATVLGALSEAGLPALVVKGAATATFYADPALRSYGDLDIMVPEAQLAMAQRVLNALGYECLASEAWWLDHFHHLPPMVGKDGGLLVELHWGLDYQADKGRLPAGDLWARAVPWNVQGQPALRLDSVDTVLHLCRHAVVQHRLYGAFRSLCDLAQITESWSHEEWTMLGRRALDYDLARSVYLMLVLAGQALNLAVPVDVIATLRPPGTLPEPGELMRRLMRSDAAPARVSVGAVQAAVDGPLGARLRHLVESVFLPREGMAMVYKIAVDSPWIWITYLWRPVDLLWRYGRSIWRTVCGEQGAQAIWKREVWLERWLRGDEQLDGL